MKYDTKRTAKYAFLIYAATNVFTYAFAHVAYLFVNDVAGEIFEYVSYYLTRVTEFIAPPVIAAIAFLIAINHGKTAALKFAASVASAKIFYSLPYYYLIFIYNYAYDSIESITLSMLASILVILATVLGTIISIELAFIVLRSVCKRTDSELTDLTAEFSKENNVVDFLSAANLPILVFALARFVFSFVTELIDTIAFFVEYRSDYQPKEIITILVNFTLLFVLLTASYLIAAHIKNALTKEDV